MRLTLERAEKLMNHAASVMEGRENYLRHSRSVGDTAAVIAKAVGLEDPDYARALGYVHDIGKHLDEKNVEWHDVLGFQYLQEQGIDEQDAWICMTHSYINGGLYLPGGGHSQGAPPAVREAAGAPLQYLRGDHQSL